MAEITHFLLVKQEKDRGREGFGLTIAAWTDINLFKLMEVSTLLCCGGMSSIPRHPANSITSCSNNFRSIQILTERRAFPLSSSSRCIPEGNVTYTRA